MFEEVNEVKFAKDYEGVIPMREYCGKIVPDNRYFELIGMSIDYHDGKN